MTHMEFRTHELKLEKSNICTRPTGKTANKGGRDNR